MYHVELSIGISPYTSSIEIKPPCIEISPLPIKISPRHVGKLACPLLKLTRISLLKSGIIKQKRDSKQCLKLLGVIIIRVWWRYLVESLHVNYQVSDGFIISYVYKVRC